MRRKPHKDRPPEHDDPAPGSRAREGDSPIFVARIGTVPSKIGRVTFRRAALCAFLLLAVVLVFGQTVSYDFVNFDDQDYVYENPQVTRGPDVAGASPGPSPPAMPRNWHPLTWLSHMLDCQLYGLIRRRASPDQRPAARRHRDPAVPGSLADDRRSLAQRLRGGRVRHPSVAGGIGGLGGGAEGRPERAVLHADPGGLRRLRPPSLLAAFAI